jgi:hypothetical protein
MIKSTGLLKTRQDSSILIDGTNYMFFKPYLSTPGSMLVEVVVYKTQELINEVYRFYLPQMSNTEVAGGIGANEYDKLIDSIENYAIAHLATYNPQVVFEKITFDN